MEGVANRGYYAVGTIYARWPDRLALLAAIGRDPIASTISAALAASGSPEESIAWILESGRSHLQLAGEILIAAHDNHQLMDTATLVWDSLLHGLERTLPPSTAWLLANYGLGLALLDAIGLPGPQPATGRVRWLADSCDVEAGHLLRKTAHDATGALEIPDVPRPERDDPTSQLLIAAAREVLRERGSPAASTRTIATAAGVTTGAIYSRYPGKAHLLADVLRSELAPGVYSWTMDVLTALASDEPYRAAADVMADRLVAAAQDETSMRVLLQIGVAARNDATLRGQVQQRIVVADEAKHMMFAHFISAGVLRADVAPGVFSWGFQTLPVGLRVTTPLGIKVDPDVVREALRSNLAAAAAR